MRRLLLILLLCATSTFAQLTTNTARRVVSGPVLPVVCMVGDVYYHTIAVAGFYGCTAPNTWTLVALGPVGGFAAGSVPFGLGGGLGEDNANFFWDNTAKQLIIGGGVPLSFDGATLGGNKTVVTVTDPTGARTFTLPNANSVAVQPDAGAANNFLTAISTLGVVSKAQPAFTNISGIATTTQGGTGANLSAAGAGTYPKASGAGVYAASTLAASGVGTPTACTSQFITGFTLAGDAAPVSTCTSIVAGDLGTTMTPRFARIGLGAAADATDPLNVYNGNALFKYGHVKFTSQVKPGAPTSNAPTDGGACTNGSHVIATTFVTGNGETEYGAVSAAQTCVLGTTKQTIPMSAIPTGIAGVTTGRNMCASKAGTVTPLYQVGASPTIADNSTTTYDFVTADASLTVACNAANSTTSGFYRDGVLMGFANDPNTSWGVYAGQSNTGASFTGMGVYAGYQNTEAYFTGVGWAAGQGNTGALFTGMGVNAGYQNTGASFTGMGVNAGYQNTGATFTGFGYATGYQNTGATFTGFGYQAGRYLADGSTGNTTSTYSLFLGANTKAAAAGETNQIVIGYNTIGAGSNTATLGNTSVVKTVLRGHVGTTQAAVPTLSACGTGTPAMEAGSTDHRGFFTTGGGVLTSCTMTFNIAYAVRPACAVYGDNAVAVVGLNWTTAVGTLVVQATSMTSQTFGYICQ